MNTCVLAQPLTQKGYDSKLKFLRAQKTAVDTAKTDLGDISEVETDAEFLQQLIDAEENLGTRKAVALMIRTIHKSNKIGSIIFTLIMGVFPHALAAYPATPHFRPAATYNNTKSISLFRCNTSQSDRINILITTVSNPKIILQYVKNDATVVTSLKNAHQQVFPSSDEHGTVISWDGRDGLIYLFLEQITINTVGQAPNRRNYSPTNYKASLRFSSKNEIYDVSCRTGQISVPNTSWLGPHANWPAPLNIWSLQLLGLAKPFNPAFDLDEWPK